MRIACVQYAPELGHVAQNAERVRKMTSTLKPGQVDLLVLPEMALTGYMFESLDEIAPILEDPYAGEGATMALASELARRIQCHVVAGFPERATPRALEKLQTQSQHDARIARDEVTGLVHLPRVARQAFNAAMLVAPDGTLVKIFRKHFLYEADTTWADEGGGFEYLDVPGLGRLCVAICMDLNRALPSLTPAYTLESEFSRYELATFCEQHRIDCLVMPMNWLLPEEEIEAHQAQTNAKDPSISTINYWVARCMPLWMPGLCEPGHEGRKTYLIACNRTGVERDIVFAGSSSIIAFTYADRADLLGTIGAQTEGMLLVDTA